MNRSLCISILGLALFCSFPAQGEVQTLSVTTLNGANGAESIVASIGGSPGSLQNYSLSDALTVTADITVNMADVGQAGQLFIVVLHDNQLLMKDLNDNWLTWDGTLDGLVPYRVKDALSSIETLEIYRDQTGIPGAYNIFVGYQTSSGALSYNSQPIFYTVGVDKTRILKTYARIGQAVYEDSLATARALKTAIEAFLANPNETTHAAAKAAWKAARVPYQQSEAYRFGNPVVDDWEGMVNAWPLDEGLIDYVDTATYSNEVGNQWAQANIIGSTGTLSFGGVMIDVSTIDSTLLRGLHEISGSEANVATGYHAIEFLLWGQDLNGTGNGAGERSFTDYLSGSACTNGNCDRRAAYLLAATNLLVEDLEYMADQWAIDGGQNGNNYATALLAGDIDEGIRKMLFGIGSLSFGELAGERMSVALIANSPEDEHDCFSDNTHASYFYDGLGIKNIYTGRYKRIDGSTLSGPSLAALVAQQGSATNDKLIADLNASQDALQKIVDAAESGMHFDQLIAPGNTTGAAIVQTAINALANQTSDLEDAATLIGIDELDPDTAGHEL